MQSFKPKVPLLIYKNEAGFTANEKEQTELMSQHFKQQFYKNQVIISAIPPTPMTIPFTKEEIKSSVKTPHTGNE